MTPHPMPHPYFKYFDAFFFDDVSSVDLSFDDMSDISPTSFYRLDKKINFIYMSTRLYEI